MVASVPRGEGSARAAAAAIAADKRGCKAAAKAYTGESSREVLQRGEEHVAWIVQLRAKSSRAVAMFTNAAEKRALFAWRDHAREMKAAREAEAMRRYVAIHQGLIANTRRRVRGPAGKANAKNKADAKTRRMQKPRDAEDRRERERERERGGESREGGGGDGSFAFGTTRRGTPRGKGEGSVAARGGVGGKIVGRRGVDAWVSSAATNVVERARKGGERRREDRGSCHSV